MALVYACGRRADTSANSFVPVVARAAKMRFAEAATLSRVVNISSEVLGEGTDFRLADTSAVFNTPCHASFARFWCANAHTEICIEDLISFASDNRRVTLAFALFGIKIEVAEAIRIASSFDVAVAVAVVVVPVVVRTAVDWGTLALASIRIPEEVVWTDTRTADALADCLIEHKTFIALFW